jgi:uncharacterized protein (TIGR02246 family)
MNSPTTEGRAGNAADENAIREIHRRMIDAWNEGNGEAFVESLTDDADFVVFEGTHLKGRREAASFTKRVFDTVVKGSRLEGEVKFVRFLSPGTAVMHAVVRTAPAGRTETTSEGRDSMELYVMTKRDGAWRTQEIINARKVSLDRQFFLDDIDSLPDEAKREVIGLVAALKQRAQSRRG